MSDVDTYGDVVAIAEVPSRDEIADALRAHRNEIVEADEWRSIAHHVRGLIRACLKGEIAALEAENHKLAEALRRAKADLLYVAGVDADYVRFIDEALASHDAGAGRSEP